MVPLARWSLLMMFLLLSVFAFHSPGTTLQSPADTQSPAPAQPFGPGFHRTYWLNGTTVDWNGTTPGPALTASDQDTITIMLRSNDTPNRHNWYFDFNNDLVVDPNEIAARSQDFQ